MGSSSSRANRRLFQNSSNANNSQQNPDEPSGFYGLLFAGQPITPQTMPSIPVSQQNMHLRSAPPPPAEIQETVTVKNLSNLHKNTIQLRRVERRAENLFQICCTMDCEVETKVELFYACVEVPDTSQPQMGLRFLPQKDLSSESFTTATSTVSPGSGIAFISPSSSPFDLSLYRNCLIYNAFMPNVYPLVIALTYKSGDGPSSSARVQRQITYVEIVKSSNKSESPSYEVKVIRQKFVIDGKVFKIAEIYGMGEQRSTQPSEGGTEPTNDDSENRSLCVICLTSERTTTVLPCGHMCLCVECAEQLRRKSTKCPVCRGVVDRLLTIQSQPQSPPENAGASASASGSSSSGSASSSSSSTLTNSNTV